jgi:FkbM family methyltransferase
MMPVPALLPPYLLGDRVVLESVSRRAAFAVRLNDDTLLCRVLGRYLMMADAEDYTVSPHLALDGYWEPWTTLAMARAVPRGAHAVDVGANHGYFTLLMALAGGSGARVLALEPNPRLAALIQRNLDLNGVSSMATVQAVAAGEPEPARARLVVPRHRSADATLLREAGEDDDVFDAPRRSIDELTSGWPCVDVVKVDAEGSEPEIWRGMARTLARNHGITVVMEFKPSVYTDAEAFVASICGEGFLLRRIDEDGTLRALTSEETLRGGECMLLLRRS